MLVECAGAGSQVAVSCAIFRWCSGSRHVDLHGRKVVPESTAKGSSFAHTTAPIPPAYTTPQSTRHLHRSQTSNIQHHATHSLYLHHSTYTAHIHHAAVYTALTARRHHNIYTADIHHATVRPAPLTNAFYFSYFQSRVRSGSSRRGKPSEPSADFVCVESFSLWCRANLYVT